jgi:hypothetical protein
MATKTAQTAFAAGGVRREIAVPSSTASAPRGVLSEGGHGKRPISRSSCLAASLSVTSISVSFAGPYAADVSYMAMIRNCHNHIICCHHPGAYDGWRPGEPSEVERWLIFRCRKHQNSQQGLWHRQQEARLCRRIWIQFPPPCRRLGIVTAGETYEIRHFLRIAITAAMDP